jgi:hypothetical protein
MGTREVHGNQVIVETNPHVRTWKYVFNTDNQRWGWMGDGQHAAAKAGYPYFTWNGWVYNTSTSQHTGWLSEEVK